MKVPNNRLTRLFVKEENLPIEIKIHGFTIKSILLFLITSVIILEILTIFNMSSEIYSRSITYSGLSKETDLEKMKNYVLSLEESPDSWGWTCTSNSFPVPNCSTLFDGWSVKLPVTNITINSGGYRGRLYAKEKPDNTQRIIFLGDSSTFGFGVNMSDTLSQVLEDLLNKNLEKNYQVINLGVSGYDTENEYDILRDMGLEYAPDLVVLMFNANDEENGTRVDEIHDNCLKNENITENMTRYQSQIFCHSYAVTLHYKELSNIGVSKRFAQIREAMEKFHELKIQYGFEVLVSYWTAHDFQKTMLEEYCSKHSWYFVDLYGILSKYPYSQLVLHERDNHPSVLFHHKVADEIYIHMIKNELFG